MQGGPFNPPPGGYGAPGPNPNPYAPPNAPGFGGPLPGGGLEAPGAKQALTYGIVAFFCCGLVFGPLAIIKANEAKKAIAMDPTLGGASKATTGMVLGIIALVLNVLGFLARIVAAAARH